MRKSQKNYNEGRFLRAIEKVITTNEMLQTGDSVLISVSGGPDSVALLHVLNSFATRYSLKLGIAHLNHSLRNSDSDNDAEFVASLAEAFDLPCYIAKKNVRLYQKKHKLSLEEAARRVRYTFLFHTAKKHHFIKIAIGHNLDDNAELILMNVFRGSGKLGISGIPPVRDGKIIRPLIELKRSEILEFLRAKKINFVDDKSNYDVKYLRNKIRLQLIPFLESSYNPRITETLGRLASILRNEEEWIDDSINSIYNESVSKAEGGKLILLTEHLGNIHLAAKRRLIRKIIKKIKGDLRQITLFHIDSVLNLLKNKTGNCRLDLPDQILIQQSNEAIYFSKEMCSLRSIKVNNKISFEYTILEPFDKSETICVPAAGISLKFLKTDKKSMSDICCNGNQVAFLNMDKIRFPLVVRNVRDGDRFTPLGMSGTQKVNKYFIKKKIARPQRAGCPVIVSEDKIVWVVGHQIDESFKVVPEARNILKIEVFLAY